jgi:hypothetical protein
MRGPWQTPLAAVGARRPYNSVQVSTGFDLQHASELSKTADIAVDIW